MVVIIVTLLVFALAIAMITAADYAFAQGLPNGNPFPAE